MPTFIRLATLTEQGVKNVQKFPQMLEEAKGIMEKHGVELIQGWVTLGEFDVVAIIEAPDANTAAQVGALISAKGNFRAKTLSAIPIAEFKSAIEKG